MLSISFPYKIFHFISLSTLHFKLLILHLLMFSLLSAGAPDTLWTRTYGGAGGEGGKSVQQTSDGGFIIAGSCVNDIYLIRTDTNGDSIWTKTYGGDDRDDGYSVKQTNDGGFIIAGNTWSFGNAIEDDIYIIKTDSLGDTSWTKTYGDTMSNQGKSVIQTSDGGFVVTGYIDFIWSGEYLCLLRLYDIGDTIWTKYFGADNYYKIGNSVQETSDGGFIICGYSSVHLLYLSKVYLIRTNLDGDTLWTKIYSKDTSYFNYGYSVKQTNDGGFIIAGSTNPYYDSSTYVYLLKTDENGDTIWTKTYGGDTTDIGRSVQQTSDGGFIICGTTLSFGSGKEDIYLIRTDLNGDTLWTKTCGGIEPDEGWSVQQTSDDGFIVAGYTKSFGAGNSDVYLIRLDKDSTAIQQEIPSNLIKPNNFIVSNNHGNISIRYTIPYSCPVKLEAYDIQGKLVKVITDKFMQKGSYSIKWDSKGFGAGVYFLRLSVNGSEVSRKVTIIK